MQAVFKGDLPAIKELLASNPDLDVNYSDYDKRTPLHIAVAEGHLELVTVLLARGAHPNAQDRWGKTPLEDAACFKRDKIALILRGSGAMHSFDPNTAAQKMCEAAKSNDVEDLKRLGLCGIEPNITDYDQRTALHIAAAEGHLDACKVLLLLGAEPLQTDRWGHTPLADAESAGHTHVAEFLRFYSQDHRIEPQGQSPPKPSPVRRIPSSQSSVLRPSGAPRESLSLDLPSARSGSGQHPLSSSSTTTMTTTTTTTTMTSSSPLGQSSSLPISSSSSSPPTTPRSKLASKEMNDSDLDAEFSATKEFEIPFGELTFVREISHGSFGVVHLGLLQGQEVAIKEIRTSANDERMQRIMILQLRREIASLNRIQHPNVVRLIGAAFVPPKVALVTEFIKGKTLLDHLKAMAAQSPDRAAILEQTIEIGLQIAKGMAFAHSLQIIHRDLKSPNVMIEDDTNRVVVIDFGSARVVHTRDSHMTKGVGSFRWIAPELFLSSIYNEKVDVYSFGIVIWECLHPGCMPLPHYTPIEAAYAASQRKVRPQITLPLSSTFSKLMRACWAENPKNRPSFATIVDILQNQTAGLLKKPKTSTSMSNLFR